MSVRPVVPGETILKPQGAVFVLEWRWEAFLQLINATAQIAVAGSSFAITGGDGDGGLTKDNDSIESGNLKTRIRISGGTAGKLYKLTNTIVTNETPTQTGVEFVMIQIV